MTLREEEVEFEVDMQDADDEANNSVAAAAAAPTPTGFKGRAASATMAASNSKAAPMAPKASTFHSNNPLVKGLELKGRTSSPISSSPPPSPPPAFESLPGSMFKINPMIMAKR
jgi:hypothetical protein